jgi:hypothetical protein
MTGDRESQRAHLDVTPDLVEYFIVTAPDRNALAHIVPALVELVDGETIRILDLAILERDEDGAVIPVEHTEIAELAVLAERAAEVGDLLSDHDLQLAAYALPPRSAALVLVTEDRWAEPLSVAARRAGGQIVAGERIPAKRITAVLDRRADERSEGL